MINMCLNSDFDEGLPKLGGGFWSSLLGTNVTKIGQAAEG